MGTFGCKIHLDALSQLRGADANDIVLASVVGRGSAEDLGADLLLVYIRAAVDQRLAANIEQKIPQSGGPFEVRTACNAIDESAPLIHGRLIQALFRRSTRY